MKKIILLVFIISIALISVSENVFPITDKEDRNQCELNVYPNPCKDKVTIRTSSEDISEIILSNITGQKVFVKKYEFPVQEVKLQVNEFPNGIYLVQLKTSENRYLVKKLIVSKE